MAEIVKRGNVELLRGKPEEVLHAAGRFEFRTVEDRAESRQYELDRDTAGKAG